MVEATGFIKGCDQRFIFLFTHTQNLLSHSAIANFLHGLWSPYPGLINEGLSAQLQFHVSLGLTQLKGEREKNQDRLTSGASGVRGAASKSRAVWQLCRLISALHPWRRCCCVCGGPAQRSAISLGQTSLHEKRAYCACNWNTQKRLML